MNIFTLIGLISFFKNLKRILFYFTYRIINSINLKIRNVEFKNDIFINGKIMVSNKGSIQIGRGCIINSGINKNPIGGDVVSRIICLNNSQIIIGDNFRMSNSTIVAQKSIEIHNNVTIGGGCKIWDSDFHSLDFSKRGTNQDIPNSKPIIIKENAFIGASSTILKGVLIGRNSIIGACSVVTKSIPDNEIWAGNPAKFIKSL